MPYVKVEKSIDFIPGGRRFKSWYLFGYWHLQVHKRLFFPRWCVERVGSFEPHVVIQAGPFVLYTSRV